MPRLRFNYGQTMAYCVVCEGPTFEWGDDGPYAQSYDECGHVCGPRCQQLDVLASADPAQDWRAIVTAALELGDATMLRFHRAACEPVEATPIELGRFDVLLEEPDGGERVVLSDMIERVEVVA